MELGNAALLSHLLFLVGFVVFLKGYFLIRTENQQKSHYSRLDVETSIKTPDRIFLFVIDGLRLDYMKKVNSDPSEPASIIHNRLDIFSRLAQREPTNVLFYGVESDPPTVTSTRLKALATGGIPSFMEVFNNLDCSRLTEDNWIEQLVNQTNRVDNDIEDSASFISNDSEMQNETTFDVHRKRFILAGDDTWAKLFPQVFYNAHSRPLESFDTHDLYTLDIGIEDFFGFNTTSNSIRSDDESDSNDFDVNNNMYDNVNKRSSSSRPCNITSGAWKMIVAHYLGVDHAGHSYDAFHPKMAERLDRMNYLIEETIRQLPENSLIMVMGDHGMTDDGNHGGATKEETETGVFIYIKRRHASLVQREALDEVCNSHDDCANAKIDVDTDIKIPYWNKSLGRFDCVDHLNIFENPRMVAQVDLVPTISSIFHLPIPYSNVGGILPELLLLLDGKLYGESAAAVADQQVNGSENSCLFMSSPSLPYLAYSLQSNVHQIFQYYDNYFGKSSQDPRLLHLQDNIPNFNCKGADRELNFTSNVTHGYDYFAKECQNYSQLNAVIKQSYVFLDLSLQLAKDLWMTYNVPQMVTGIFIMILASLICVKKYFYYFISERAMYSNLDSDSDNINSETGFTMRSISSINGLLLLVTVGMGFLHVIGPFSDNLINYENDIHSYGAMIITILVVMDRIFCPSVNITPAARRNGVMLSLTLFVQTYTCFLWSRNKTSDFRNTCFTTLFYLLLFQAFISFLNMPTTHFQNSLKTTETAHSDSTTRLPLCVRCLGQFEVIFHCFLSATLLILSLCRFLILYNLAWQYFSKLLFGVIVPSFDMMPFPYSFLSNTLIDLHVKLESSNSYNFNKSIILLSIAGLAFNVVIKLVKSSVASYLNCSETNNYCKLLGVSIVEWSILVYSLSLTVICVESAHVALIYLTATCNFIFTCSYFLDKLGDLVPEKKSIHKWDFVYVNVSFHLYIFIFMRFTFFATGHSLQLNDFPVSVGPLVLGEFHFFLAPFVVLFNCLAPEFIFLLILKLMIAIKYSSASLVKSVSMSIQSDNASAVSG